MDEIAIGHRITDDISDPMACGFLLYHLLDPLIIVAEQTAARISHSADANSPGDNVFDSTGIIAERAPDVSQAQKGYSQFIHIRMV
jgi:hypothetical protein